MKIPDPIEYNIPFEVNSKQLEYLQQNHHLEFVGPRIADSKIWVKVWLFKRIDVMRKNLEKLQ